MNLVLVVRQEELAAAVRQQAAADRDLAAARRENRRLSRSLQESRQNLEELHRQREKQVAAKRAVRSLHSKHRDTRTSSSSVRRRAESIMISEGS